MCGFVATDSSDNTRIRKALKILSHRGPDGEGFGRFNGLGLAHRRLSIVDPQGGSEPMTDEGNTWALVFNGEIYNHLALRKRLQPKFGFRTRCDAEVIGPLWQEFGVEGLRFLDGMFAFVLSTPFGWVAGRDCLGIKPLYVMKDKNHTWFASEIKALHAAGRGAIREFPPGFSYSSTGGFRRLHTFPIERIPMDNRAARNQIRATLAQAVEKRLMADVPVGVFLSGGLDSGIIAALAKVRRRELHTFSVGLPGSSDLIHAREVSRFLGTVHHERILSPYEIMDALPRIIYHLESFDRDLVRSAVPCWFVSEMASRHVKVALTGEGADELFAGYRHLGDHFSGESLARELRRLLRGLHWMNLQRLDRMTMAHGLEGRVPFLDLEMIRLAKSLSPADLERTHLKQDKRLLRAAFEGFLPRAVLERQKSQFDEGTGVGDLLARLAEGTLGKSPEPRPGLPLARDREEAWYQEVFLAHFDANRVGRTLGAWNPPEGEQRSEEEVYVIPHP